MKTLRRASLLIVLAMILSLMPALSAARTEAAVGTAEMTITPSRTIAPGVATTIDIKIVATGFYTPLEVAPSR